MSTRTKIINYDRELLENGYRSAKGWPPIGAQLSPDDDMELTAYLNAVRPLPPPPFIVPSGAAYGMRPQGLGIRFGRTRGAEGDQYSQWIDAPLSDLSSIAHFLSPIPKIIASVLQEAQVNRINWGLNYSEGYIWNEWAEPRFPQFMSRVEALTQGILGNLTGAPRT